MLPVTAILGSCVLALDVHHGAPRGSGRDGEVRNLHGGATARQLRRMSRLHPKHCTVVDGERLVLGPLRESMPMVAIVRVVRCGVVLPIFNGGFR